MTGPRIAGARQEGFVLVAAAWFVALLALAAVIISGWVSGSLRGAAALRDQMVARVEMTNATNEVAYLMVSNFFSVRGLEVLNGAALKAALEPQRFELEMVPPKDRPFLALDGRPYRFGNGVIELQDPKGLYNLHDASPASLARLLDFYGTEPRVAQRLYDKLLDYQGTTPFKRINGATADDYAAAGRPPPRGAALITSWEPLRILDWDSQKMWTGPMAFPEMASADPAQGFNPNTAPPMVLRSFLGLDQDAADRLLSLRSNIVLQNFYQLQAVAGEELKVSPFQISDFPDDRVRLKGIFANDPHVHIAQIVLTPAADRPYEIDYAFDLPRDPSYDAIFARHDVPAFPALADIP